MRLCIKGFRVCVMSQTDPGWRELVSCASRASVSEGCALPARDITGTVRSQWGFFPLWPSRGDGMVRKGLVPRFEYFSGLEM